MSTSFQQLSQSTFIVTFKGTKKIHTTVTASGDVAATWLYVINHTLSEYVVGMATESLPSFSEVENAVASLQLCIGYRCLIFQLQHAIPDSLKKFLSHPHHIFFGVGIGCDVRHLEGMQLSVLNSVDLRILASERTGRPEMLSKGFNALALEIMGFDVKKPRHVTMSRWNRWRLTPDQIMYACFDAFASYEIGKLLHVRVF